VKEKDKEQQKVQEEKDIKKEDKEKYKEKEIEKENDKEKPVMDSNNTPTEGDEGHKEEHPVEERKRGRKRKRERKKEPYRPGGKYYHANNRPQTSGPFGGLTFRLGKSIDKPDLAEKIVQNGGVVLQYTTKHTTHYLTTLHEYEDKGSQILSAIKKLIYIVSEDFVHDSVSAGRKLNEKEYIIDKMVDKG